MFHSYLAEFHSDVFSSTVPSKGRYSKMYKWCLGISLQKILAHRNTPLFAKIHNYTCLTIFAKVVLCFLRNITLKVGVGLSGFLITKMSICEPSARHVSRIFVSAVFSFCGRSERDAACWSACVFVAWKAESFDPERQGLRECFQIEVHRLFDFPWVALC